MGSKKKSAPFVNIGSSSLLVIFMVLCLVTFATLSLSSAQSDYKFSQRLADRRTDYYTASNQAEEVLHSVDTVLAGAYEMCIRDSMYGVSTSHSIGESSSSRLRTTIDSLPER